MVSVKIVSSPTCVLAFVLVAPTPSTINYHRPLLSIESTATPSTAFLYSIKDLCILQFVGGIERRRVDFIESMTFVDLPVVKTKKKKECTTI
jgi:hypothetical protein